MAKMMPRSGLAHVIWVVVMIISLSVSAFGVVAIAYQRGIQVGLCAAAKAYHNNLPSCAGVPSP